MSLLSANKLLKLNINKMIEFLYLVIFILLIFFIAVGIAYITAKRDEIKYNKKLEKINKENIKYLKNKNDDVDNSLIIEAYKYTNKGREKVYIEYTGKSFILIKDFPVYSRNVT